MIFDEQLSRKPDHYPWASEIVKAFWKSFWTPEGFTFQSDLHDFKVTLTEQERGVVVNALSAISQIEVAVKRFWSKLGDQIRNPSISDLCFTMASTEVIHGRAYEKLLDVLGLQDVFEQNLKNDVIRGRVKYLQKHGERNYRDDKKQCVYSLILFTLFIENVSLFSQFYVIMWFNKYRKVLKDADQQIKYTRIEEDMHALSGMRIINDMRREYPELLDDDLRERVIKQSKAAFKAEANIVDWMLGEYTGTNLSAPILKEFIKDRLNISLTSIGYDPVFDIDQKLLAHTHWMNEEVKGNMMTDFFHQHPTEYSKSHASFDEADLFA